MARLIDTIDVGNALGEGVVWDYRSELLYWVDIENQYLYQFDVASGKVSQFSTPSRLCSFGLCDRPGYIIAAFEQGFAYYAFQDKQIQWIQKPNILQGTDSQLRLNDGRVDRQGRFWCGAMVEGENKEPCATLYCLHQGQLSEHESNIAISNGICWSPESEHFYFADSPRNVIYRYDFNADTGTINNKKIFAQTPAHASPDGAVTDESGCLWSAHWGAGQVVRYTPTGEIDQTISIPTCQPTCVAFGGSNNDILFVTTAKQNLQQKTLAKEPQAGNVFLYQMPVRGIPEPIYQYTHH